MPLKRPMARIIVLGGGRQGRIIANDLAGDHDVTVADVTAVNIPGIRSMQRALSRPTRIIRDGKVVEVPALSGLETIKIPGVGDVEAFFTDGLRTLLSEANPPVGGPRIKNMTEKTIRWPGHVKAVKPLIANGTLVKELTEKCREGADLVVFRVQVDGDVVTMVDRARDGMFAMARTTALTCAAFARSVAAGQLPFHRMVPPDELASQ